MKRLLLSSLKGCMLMGQAFATQEDADHLIIVEQMPVDKEIKSHYLIRSLNQFVMKLRKKQQHH